MLIGSTHPTRSKATTPALSASNEVARLEAILCRAAATLEAMPYSDRRLAKPADRLRAMKIANGVRTETASLLRRTAALEGAPATPSANARNLESTVDRYFSALPLEATRGAAQTRAELDTIRVRLGGRVASDWPFPT